MSRRVVPFAVVVTVAFTGGAITSVWVALKLAERILP